MRFTQSWLAIGAIVVAAGALPVDSIARPSLEARVEHIERQLENKITLETINSIESLKTEIQQLHGKIDEQQHALQQLSQRQAKLFLDLEQRIGQAPQSSSNVTINPATGHAVHTGEVVAPSAAMPSAALPKVAEKLTTTANAASTTNKAKPAASEQELYNDAYKLVESKRYKEAQVALQDFLWQHPDGKYVANAHYWLGEIYLSEWHSDRNNKLSVEKAISSFKSVITKYATHQKAADSLLKLGIIAAEQQDLPAAKQYFNQLKQDYPGSSPAHLADVRLQQLGGN